MPSPKPNPAKPYSRHRKSRAGMVVLPADGCDYPPPPLPKGRRWTAAERELWLELWLELWRSPQAVMFDDSFAPVVAMYVSHAVAVLGGRASAWQAQEARYLADRLGLTPSGMAALGWRLPEPGEDTGDVVALRAVQ